MYIYMKCQMWSVHTVRRVYTSARTSTEGGEPTQTSRNEKGAPNALKPTVPQYNTEVKEVALLPGVLMGAIQQYRTRSAHLNIYT